MAEDAEEYLRHIIEYCQERKIEITLFSSPIYMIELMLTEDYDRYAEGIKNIAEEYGVVYYDFNMAKEEYLPIQYPEYFKDAGHLNANGAEIYTNFFYNVVSEVSEDNTVYFYDSYREKLKYSKPNVYGVYSYNLEGSEGQEGDEEGNIRRMMIASIREKELEYRILLTPEGGKTVLKQDFSVNKKFNISAEEHGCCEIIWRDIKNTGEAGTIEVQY